MVCFVYDSVFFGDSFYISCCFGFVMVRTKGSKNKHGYHLSAKAYNQRVLAPLKDGKHSAFFNKIVLREKNDPKYGEELAGLKLEFWKRTNNSPALALLDLASELYAFIEAERLRHVEKGDGFLSKDVITATKSLVDIMKELSRVSMVSADKKLEFLQGKNLDDLSFEIDNSEGKKNDDGGGLSD